MRCFNFYFLVVIVLVSCSRKEPAVVGLQKDHSVEVTLETKKMGDSLVLLFTKQNVYLRGKLVKTMMKTDTLPSAGDTLQTVETDDSVYRAHMPKEYEFFVTVK